MRGFNTCRTQRREACSRGSSVCENEQSRGGRSGSRPSPPCHGRFAALVASALKQDAKPGVDGETWEEYGQQLEANLKDLHEQVQRGSYRPLPFAAALHRQRGWTPASPRRGGGGGESPPRAVV